MNDISFIPLGGIGDVTRNMYVYEQKEEILIVDCGLGFADETMLGVDLLLPDISYLKETKKKIVGLVLTHGHEDHIGALPFVLDQLPPFPILATPLTAALANEKLREFGLPPRVRTVTFNDPEQRLGKFSVSFIRITHSVPDASNLFIKTPSGNFYHASDFKFDLTPADGKRAQFEKIIKAGNEKVTCLMSDSLGAEKPGHTPSEEALGESFEREMRNTPGKFIVTTYSSNISRLNQAIKVAEMLGRKVCFVGRSLVKAKDVAQRLGYMQLKRNTEINVNQIRRYKDKDLLLLVAGSQGQENSAMTRIANDEHKEIRLTPLDTVVFSADSIPGNEVSVFSLIDTIAKTGAKVFYSEVSDEFHVSGHGSSQDLMLMISLVRPRMILPISGTYRQMVAYRELCGKMGYRSNDVFLIENGQEIIFSDGRARPGKKIEIKNVYVDQMSGEEVESFVLRDRQRISEGGIVIVMAEVSAATGQIVDAPSIIIRGLPASDVDFLHKNLEREIKNILTKKAGPVTNWIYVRRLIGDISEKFIYRELRKQPLVLPVVVKV